MNQIHLSAFWTTLARLARHLFAERWLRQNAPALVTRTTQSKPPIVRRRNSYSKPASARQNTPVHEKSHSESNNQTHTNKQTSKQTRPRQTDRNTSKHTTHVREHTNTLHYKTLLRELKLPIVRRMPAIMLIITIIPTLIKLVIAKANVKENALIVIIIVIRNRNY